MRVYCQSWWVLYLLPPSCSIVLFVRYGAGLASDRTEVTAVTSVLVRSVRRAYSYQSKHTELCSTSPCPAQGP
jgi:hypothetical protein